MNFVLFRFGLLAARLLVWMERSIRPLTRKCPRTPHEKPPAFLPLAERKSCEECPVWGARLDNIVLMKDWEEFTAGKLCPSLFALRSFALHRGQKFRIRSSSK